jgi:hypothetical protein
MKSGRQNMLNRLSILKKAPGWIFLGSAAVAATRSYYAQEMLASLVLFAFLFGCVAAILLVFVVLDRAAEAVLRFLKSHGKPLLQHLCERGTFREHQYRI